MQSEEDLVERVLDRLPTVQEAEAVLSKLEDELLTVETINAGLSHEDLLGEDGIGFTELQCDVVLLSDEMWESKYGAAAVAADRDPYAWMAASLARLLPGRLQAPSRIWQETISALRVADVRSEAQLLGMTKAQLRSVKVPVAASVHLQIAPVRAGTRMLPSACQNAKSADVQHTTTGVAPAVSPALSGVQPAAAGMQLGDAGCAGRGALGAGGRGDALSGRVLTVQLLSNWGDMDAVGLCGLDILSADGSAFPVIDDMVPPAATPPPQVNATCDAVPGMA